MTCADDSGWTSDRFNNAPSVDGHLVSDNGSVKREIVFDEPRGTGVKRGRSVFQGSIQELNLEGLKKTRNMYQYGRIWSPAEYKAEGQKRYRLREFQGGVNDGEG